MKYKRTLIKGGTVVNEGQSVQKSIFIVGETIADITDSENDIACYMEQADEVVDAAGCLVIPGVIDTHVHFRTPGSENKGTIFTESRAAALGGVTSYMDMPNNNPPADSIDVLEWKFDKASADSAVNYSFYIGASNSNITEVLSCDRRRICGVKVFMGSSTGNMLVDNDGTLSAIFEKSALPVAVHCEDESIIKANLSAAIEKYGPEIPPSAHPLIRSSAACTTSTSKALNLALQSGTRLHICHISTAEEVESVRRAKQLSDRITAETCVHYLTYCDEDYSVMGNRIKCNPSIKTRMDMMALRKAVTSGLIDSVATDHAPHLLHEKERDYLHAPSGIPQIQTSLQMMLELDDIPVTAVVESMCHAPARLFSIKERGFIRPGYYADIVVVDTKKSCTVKPACKCGWLPRTNFSSTIIHTFVNGSHLVDKGMLKGTVNARPLEFNR